MMIGLVHPGSSRGTLWQMIGSRKITPPRMLRIVPFGERYISCRLNSFTRASSGVMVAHFTATPTFLVASAASIEIGMDQLVLDVFPNDPGHFVAIHLDYRIGDFDLVHWDLDLCGA